MSCSDNETATSSRHRRRVTLATKVAAEEVTKALSSQLHAIQEKIDQLLIASLPREELGCRVSRLESLLGLHEQHCFALEDRVRRLEALYVSSADPEIDAVIGEMLKRKTSQSQCASESATCDTLLTERDELAIITQTAELYNIADVKEEATQTVAMYCCRDTPVDTKMAEYLNMLVGEWVPLNTPVVGDVIKVIAPFVDATVGVQIQLTPSTIGKVIGVDAEGDAEVRFAGLSSLCAKERNRWILAANFRNLEKFIDKG